MLCVLRYIDFFLHREHRENYFTKRKRGKDKRENIFYTESTENTENTEIY